MSQKVFECRLTRLRMRGGKPPFPYTTPVPSLLQERRDGSNMLLALMWKPRLQLVRMLRVNALKLRSICMLECVLKFLPKPHLSQVPYPG